MRAIYFGCVGRPGHYFHEAGRRNGIRNDGWPWEHVDGALTPRSTQKQGFAALHHKGGWTALAAHDYTVDSRPGSNVVFMFDAHLTYDEAIVAATEHWPDVMARIGSTLTEAAS